MLVSFSKNAIRFIYNILRFYRELGINYTFGGTKTLDNVLSEYLNEQGGTITIQV